MTERQRARPQTARAQISNPVSGEQCHLIHLTILRRFSWPSLAYIYTKVAIHSFFLIKTNPNNASVTYLQRHESICANKVGNLSLSDHDGCEYTCNVSRLEDKTLTHCWSSVADGANIKPALSKRLGFAVLLAQDDTFGRRCCHDARAMLA